MATYRYRAIDRAGHVTEGVVTASDVASLAATLQRRGFTPLGAEEVSDESAHTPVASLQGKGLPTVALGMLIDELATLLQSGLTVDRALGIVGASAESTRVRLIVGSLRAEVAEGQPLSGAMSRQPAVFGRTVVSVVRAGEAAGALAPVLQRLAGHTLKVAALRDKLVTTLIYPVLLLMVTAISLAVILWVVLPRFEESFQQMDASLPTLTVALLALGRLLREYGWLLVLLGLVAGAAAYEWLKSPQHRYRLHAWALSAPIIGPYITMLESVRACRTLGLLLANGAVLTDALGHAREAVFNLAFAQGLQRANDEVKTGRRLSDALSKAAIMPEQAIQLVRVGEESGELSAMLEKLAAAQEHKLEMRLSRAVTLIEPALILSLAAIIAIVILALMLAVLGLSDVPL